MFLKNSKKNTSARVSFLITLQAGEHRWLFVNFAKFSRTSCLEDTSGKMLLSTVSLSGRINKPITKLIMQIMLLFWFFVTQYIIMHVFHEIIRDPLDAYENTVVDCMAVNSYMFLFSNSFSNTLLSLITNVKAKWFLKNSGTR